jgi:hypothetical protein
LIESFPEFNWEFEAKSMSSKNKKTQYLLKSTLKTMFPKDGKKPRIF